jgi:voltage-gated potassium channel
MTQETQTSTRKAPSIGWDMFLLGTLCLSVFIVPLEVLFHAADSWLLLATDIGLSAVLVLDYFLCGELNQSLSEYNKRSGSFFASAAPVFAVAFLVGMKPLWIPLLQLNHLLRAPLVFRRINLRGQQRRIGNGAKLFFILLATFLFIHCLACLWMLIQPGTEDVLTNYNRALYYVITTITTVGYGDITPQTNIGRVFAMMTMLLGVLFYGVVIGQVSRFIVSRDRRKEDEAEKLENLAGFLKHYDIPPELQDETYRYYRHLLAQKVTGNESHILDELPAGLRSRLTDHINIKPLAKLSLFRNCSQECLLAAAHALQPAYFDAGKPIVTKGEHGEDMYIIRFGRVRIHDGPRLLTELAEGQCFGEMSLVRSEPRTADVTAVTMCDLFVLHKEDFDRLLGRFPTLKRNVDELAGRRSGLAAS